MKQKDIQKNEKKVSKNKKTKKVKNQTKIDKEIIKTLEEQIKEQKDNYLIALADLENDRKRFEKSKHEFIKFANRKVLGELIKILDTFNMAMNIKDPSSEVKNFLIGFKMIENQFKNLLESNGISKIEVQPGDEFDSELHFSMEEVDSEQFKPGQITTIIKDGYKIHKILLRPAMVKVVKNKQDKE